MTTSTIFTHSSLHDPLFLKKPPGPAKGLIHTSLNGEWFSIKLDFPTYLDYSDSCLGASVTEARGDEPGFYLRPCHVILKGE
jgi:hypothetical protein